jgi:hypothetical protein
MRHLSIIVLEFLTEKSIMTSLASGTIYARCGDCVRVIVEFRDERPDPDETPDESKLTGFN